MRSFRAGLAGAVVMGPLLCFVAGCGGGGDLEKPPETPKKVDPMTDMPGFKEQQEKLKAAGKIK
jgi:hypothetical protein